MTTPREPKSEEVQAVKRQLYISAEHLIGSFELIGLGPKAAETIAKWHLSEVAALKEQVERLKDLLKRHHDIRTEEDKYFIWGPENDAKYYTPQSKFYKTTLAAIEKGKG